MFGSRSFGKLPDIDSQKIKSPTTEETWAISFLCSPQRLLTKWKSHRWGRSLFPIFGLFREGQIAANRALEEPLSPATASQTDTIQTELSISSYVIFKIPAQSDIRLHGFNPLNLRKSQCQNKCDSFKIFNLIHLHATLEEAAKSNIG